MKLRKLGNSDLTVSISALGCSNFGERIPDDAAAAVIERALEEGITFFDTADVYGKRGGSESFLGKRLGTRRKQLVLATKFGRPMNADGSGGGTSRAYVSEAVEASLKRLKTDWIDLLQIHWPYPETPIEDTLRGLDDVLRAGKVRYIGCSNFAAWQLVEAQLTARHHGLPQFVTTQEEYSLLDRHAEHELLPAAAAYEVGLLPYLPLAGGFLSGKYSRDGGIPAGLRLDVNPILARRYLKGNNWNLLQRLTAYHRQSGRSMIELALGWVAAQPGVISILSGATGPEQVTQNVAAANCALTSTELDDLQRLADSEAESA